MSKSDMDEIDELFEDDKQEGESSRDWQLRLESKYGKFIL